MLLLMCCVLCMHAGLLRCVVPRWVLQRDLEGVEGRVFKKSGRHAPALGAVSYSESEERMTGL